jgi:proteasome lid subunit RPN8/RPN11
MRDALLAETAHTLILRAAELAEPFEAGGLLLGVHQGKRLWVTHALIVPSGRTSPSHYELPAGVTRTLVTCARLVDARLGYVGEWHSHPANQRPSQTDANTIMSLDPSPDGRSPLLLLARKGPKGYKVEGYRWSKRFRYSPSLRKTGDLPEGTRNVSE